MDYTLEYSNLFRKLEFLFLFCHKMPLKCEFYYFTSSVFQEIEFFALHGQFHQPMPPFCNGDSPCIQKNDRTGKSSKVPENCTFFYGVVEIGSMFQFLYNYSRIQILDLVSVQDLQNLRNLEILIGEIRVEGTLLSDFQALSRLKVIYSFRKLQDYSW